MMRHDYKLNLRDEFAKRGIAWKMGSGNRYKITVSTFSGSFWIQRMMGGHRFKFTGDLGEVMIPWMRSNYGEPSYLDQGADVWLLKNESKLLDILDQFSSVLRTAKAS